VTRGVRIKKMRWNRKRRALAVIVGVYCTLWVLTATWGIANVNRAFDREFATGLVDLGTRSVDIKRIDKMANVRDLMDPANKFPDDTGRFRFRTHGIAIAPFLIVDEAATVFASMGGYGGRRLNLWFFGFTKWWSLKMYWAV
jgi:hypothetical protein